MEGYALGGGLEIALCADLIVAAADARLGLPEVKRGLVASAGGAIRLPRRVPFAAAMELILTGEPITAHEALKLGLINRDHPEQGHSRIPMSATLCCVAAPGTSSVWCWWAGCIRRRHPALPGWPGRAQAGSTAPARCRLRHPATTLSHTFRITLAASLLQAVEASRPAGRSGMRTTASTSASSPSGRFLQLAELRFEDGADLPGGQALRADRRSRRLRTPGCQAARQARLCVARRSAEVSGAARPAARAPGARRPSPLPGRCRPGPGGRPVAGRTPPRTSRSCGRAGCATGRLGRRSCSWPCRRLSGARPGRASRFAHDDTAAVGVRPTARPCARRRRRRTRWCARTRR